MVSPMYAIGVSSCSFLSAECRLHLPSDQLRDTKQAWLRIAQPKTRFLNARVQLARCDEVWVVLLLKALFQHLPANARLWTLSSSAFRKRWDALGAALRVPTVTGKGLTPGSLRGGGATQFYVLTEDLPRLQLRARWRRVETLQIYVQEISPVEFLVGLPPGVRAGLQRAAARLPGAVQLALQLLRQKVPTKCWHSAFSSLRAG